MLIHVNPQEGEELTLGTFENMLAEESALQRPNWRTKQSSTRQSVTHQLLGWSHGYVFGARHMQKP